MYVGLFFLEFQISCVGFLIADFILSCLFVIDDIQALVKEEKQYVYERRYHSLHTTIITVLFLQVRLQATVRLTND